MEINLIHGKYGEIPGKSIQKVTEHPWKICGDFMRKFTGHRRSNHGKIGTWIMDREKIEDMFSSNEMGQSYNYSCVILRDGGPVWSSG